MDNNWRNVRCCVWRVYTNLSDGIKEITNTGLLWSCEDYWLVKFGYNIVALGKVLEVKRKEKFNGILTSRRLESKCYDDIDVITDLMMNLWRLQHRCGFCCRLINVFVRLICCN